MQSCELWMFVKEKPDREEKMNSKNEQGQNSSLFSEQLISNPSE